MYFSERFVDAFPRVIISLYAQQHKTECIRRYNGKYTMRTNNKTPSPDEEASSYKSNDHQRFLEIDRKRIRYKQEVIIYKRADVPCSRCN